jgi:predicted secreted protein with PEFG-CTERM motif
LDITAKGFTLIAILAATAGAVPAFAYCPPDCAPKLNYQVGANGSYEMTNYTGGNLTTGNFVTTTSAVTVTTDRPSYNDGDKIMISGSVAGYQIGMPVSVLVRNPIGNIVSITQVELGNGTSYSTTITAGGGLWQAAGSYSITAQYGGQERQATTSFMFSGSKGVPQTFLVDGTNFKLPYSITNGKVTDIATDVQSKSLIVTIQTTGDGTLTLTMPRALIDAKKSDGTDDKFFVLNDDQENDLFQESGTSSTDRTLSIPFTDGTTKIEIIGTVVVPEFGPIAALVLAIAIMSIIAVSAKTGLRLMPKY